MLLMVVVVYFELADDIVCMDSHNMCVGAITIR